jgi:hypothetical protein
VTAGFCRGVWIMRLRGQKRAAEAFPTAELAGSHEKSLIVFWARLQGKRCVDMKAGLMPGVLA